MSADPALGSYIGNNADKLPGQGGAFNPVNLSLYCYAGNNPIRYIDPNGMSIVDDAKKIISKVWSFITGGNKNKESSSALTKSNKEGKNIEMLKQKGNSKYAFDCYNFAPANELIGAGAKFNKSRDEVMDKLSSIPHKPEALEAALNEMVTNKEVKLTRIDADSAKDMINNNKGGGNTRLVIEIGQLDYWGEAPGRTNEKSHFVGFVGKDDTGNLTTRDSWNATIYTNRGTIDQIKSGFKIDIKNK